MRTSSWSIACVVSLGAFTLACARQRSGEAPDVVVAQSRDAQVDLRDLREQWALAGSAGRKQLRPDLEAFLERHPDDPTSAEVRVMLARVALSERRHGAVLSILEPVLAGPTGAVRDEAKLVVASLDNAEGRHESALERLAPLRGKLLSEEARDQWHREYVTAALEARRWRLAVDTMGDWLRQDGVRSQDVRTWVKEVLLEVPVGALARMLQDWDEETARSKEERSAREWLQRKIVSHLSRVAIQQDDPQLARDLLAHAPPWLRASEHGDRLVVLSARASREARVSGRILGVVVGGATSQAKRRSIRAAAGVALVLAEAGLDAKVQLLPVEARGSTRAALGTLSGLGAALLIAGVDATSATEALSFAAEKKVPVIALHPPSQPVDSPFAFVLGVSEEQQQAAGEARFPAVRTWQLVSRPAECRAVPAEEKAGETGLLVLGDETCLRQLPGRVWKRTGPVLVGLAAAHGPFRGAKPIHFIQSAGFPNDPWFVGATSEAQAEGRPEDWFYVLGRDAGRLAKATLLELPSTAVVDQRRVAERHLEVAQALRRARSALTSSSASGFDQRGRVQHRLRVESLRADSRAQGEARP